MTAIRWDLLGWVLRDLTWVPAGWDLAVAARLGNADRGEGPEQELGRGFGLETPVAGRDLGAGADHGVVTWSGCSARFQGGAGLGASSVGRWRSREDHGEWGQGQGQVEGGV